MISLTTLFFLGVIAILLAVVSFLAHGFGQLILGLARLEMKPTWRDKCFAFFSWFLLVGGIVAVFASAILWIARHMNIT